MNFEEAKNTLRDRYVAAGLILSDEHKNALYFKDAHGRGPIELLEGEISKYQDFEGRRAQYSVAPVEVSMLSMKYREHAIRPTDIDRRFSSFSRDISLTFGANGDLKPYVQISLCSEDYLNFFRFHDGYLPYSIMRMQRPFIRRGERSSMIDNLVRPLTIKVFNLNSSSIDEARKLSDGIIDSALFSAACLKDITIDLQTEWPRRGPHIEPFRFEESPEGSELPLPHALYNPDLVRFYIRGCSASDPVVQFLSFYQVLEYFFLTTSDEQLYTKLSARLRDPHFSAIPRNLDLLIQDTLDHKRESDETEMLKLVLQRYVNEPDVIKYITSYEAYLKDQLYTKKRSVFGEESQVSLQPGHIIGGLSRRIKLIRNALIHSSDRHERKDRYVPTKANEQLIEKEVPLVEFLAERVIISTAQSL